MFIGVIGGGEASKEIASTAEEVGRELAKRGCTVVCGGLLGVMEAACKGAKSAGGRTIGIIPGRFRCEANKYVDIPIVTGMGHARNVIVVRSSQAVIAIDGSSGTLSEIGHALAEGIPVIGLKTWSLSMNGTQDSSIILAKDAVDAVERAIAAAREREQAGVF